MDDKSNSHLPGKGDTPRKPTEKFEDPYKDIPLTEEEIENALRQVRAKKAGFIYEKEYAARILKPITFEKYTAEQLKERLFIYLKETIPLFIVDKYNEENIFALCLYFTRDPRFLDLDKSFSFDKGLGMQGPIGCGKTTLLNAFRSNPTNSYQVSTCRSVADEYTDKEFGGNMTIRKYGQPVRNQNPQRDYFGQEFLGMAFDDLGVEDMTRHFGNQKNVLGEIMLERYDNYLLKGKTHVTTNLSFEQIEQFYGPRVLSRFSEMLNFIQFDTQAKDRRR